MTDMKKLIKFNIVFLLLSLAISCKSQDPNKITGLKAKSEFKSQTKKLATDHEWVSFKYRYIHNYDNKIVEDLIISISMKYDKSNSLVFIAIGNDTYYLLTNDTYKNLDHVKRNILDIRKNKADKDDLYKNIGRYGSVSNIMYHISYYLKQIDFAYVWPVRLSISECESVSIGDVPHNRYVARQFGEVIECFVDKKTNTLDSVCSVFKYDGHTIDKYYKMYDFDFGNKQQYIDSVFDFGNQKYSHYAKYDEFTMPVMSMQTDDACDIMDFPLVNLDGDTVTLREQEGWVLLNFWTMNCGPCLANLQNYKHEQDSLGYRILENEGVKILAVEHRSDNMELIGKVADRTNCRDIMYSAKNISTKISIPYLGYYYLIDPSKKFIWKDGSLGDYSSLLKAKREHEINMKK